MKGYYLKEYPVPIPYGAGPVVVRNGKTVQFQTERDYTYGRENTRVKRRVIGKINPEIREMMFPNETYFELIPNNPVPVEVREDFLSECQRKREIEAIKKDPEALMKSIAEGLAKLQREGAEMNGDYEMNPEEEGRRYALARSVFDQLYTSIMDLAEKHPNEVVDQFKVRMINDVLDEMRAYLQGEYREEYLKRIEEPAEKNENGVTTLKGLTYSDVYMAMQWYKILQRRW